MKGPSMALYTRYVPPHCPYTPLICPLCKVLEAPLVQLVLIRHPNPNLVESLFRVFGVCLGLTKVDLGASVLRVVIMVCYQRNTGQIRATVGK